ncbi:MAG TPA: hypothetical protein DCE41_29470 [Cytophagales bacterium]|nr:hypothetical protein [Cytophagales bacterium]HAA18568.1 hypothetical protein [Cytophagales bacterium]
MKILRKIFKWTGISIGSVLLLIVLAGMSYRWLGPAPQAPKGELVDVGGFRLHIHATGAKSDRPTVVMECGAGLTTEFFHWLNEGLQDSLWVVRYDRAGLGFSDGHQTPRDPETIAHELHTLLQKAGEEPPYLLVGHSLGGPYIRVFADLYPEEVAGLFFLDATHPQQVELFNAPEKTSLKFRAYMALLGVQAVAGELGIVGLYDRLFDFPYRGQGLPAETNHRVKQFLQNGKLISAYRAEIMEYHATLRRSDATGDFGDLPIRVFNAHQSPDHTYGIATEPWEDDERHPHQDYADLSTDGKLAFLYGNHVSIYTEKENADLICDEILQVVRELEP